VVEPYVGLVRKKLETVSSPVIFTIRLNGYAMWLPVGHT
jgi:DNA-binding response OmpR family regulator